MSGSRLTIAQSNYLDVLRGGAAQLVLIGHIYSTANSGRTLGIGDLGVIVFFILSGFLISYSALLKRERGSYQMVDYMRDRFFRIFVPYLPALLLVLLLDAMVFHFTDSLAYREHFNAKDFLATLLMLQQHPVGLFSDQLLDLEALKLSTFGSARPWWTVANEWWLYVCFGLVLFISNQRNFINYLILLGVVSIVPLFNSVAGTGQGLSLIWVIMAFLGWIYLRWGREILVVTKNTLAHSSRAKLSIVLMMMLFFVLAVVRVVWISYIEKGFVFERPEFYDFNLYIILLITFSLTLLLFGLRESSSRLLLVRFIADYSYSLYLVHYTLIYAWYAFGYLDATSWINQILCYISCNITAIMFYMLTERNYKRLQRYYERWRGLGEFRHG